MDIIDDRTTMISYEGRRELLKALRVDERWITEGKLEIFVRHPDNVNNLRRILLFPVNTNNVEVSG